ncbi:hypothetical protein PROFUN_16791 [Planoprotostelium fungivorum]|uniref:Uncharacterized protein n=1 Tax=Planoprotostelium fungivorum TaxID=1890364 RepID=A0A2P6MNT0_9EUKA|nr:hypothetical protein PROFUN_16791 [Planoprotostelium fungivorum]
MFFADDNRNTRHKAHPQTKDLQRRSCLETVSETVSTRQRRDKQVLSRTVSRPSRFYSFSFRGTPGTNPLQDHAPRVEREESKDIERLLAKACHMTTRDEKNLRMAVDITSAVTSQTWLGYHRKAIWTTFSLKRANALEQFSDFNPRATEVYPLPHLGYDLTDQQLI